MQVLGISSGFLGLIENDYFEIKEKHLSGILTMGGTILGTSQEKPLTMMSGEQRARAKKEYSIVVVAEGIVNGSKKGAGTSVAKKINKLTGLETRETVLGYIQRGGSPTPMDRILATRYAAS